MAQDQGTQFEWCVLHTAYSRLTNPEVLSSTQLKTKEKALTNWDKANSTVRNHAKNVIDKLVPSSPNESVNFYRSFEKMGSGSKSDIVFYKGNTLYQCSMKYGDSFQLSSSMIETNVTVLTDIFKKISRGKGAKTDGNTLANIQKVINDVEAFFPNKYMTSNDIDSLVKHNPNAAALEERLIEIIGTKGKDGVGSVYDEFRCAFVEESITGKMTLKGKPMQVATHILTEKGVRPITKKLVHEFCAIVNPRFSKKKQGTFPKTRQLGKGVLGPKEMIPASLQGVTQYNPVIRLDVKLG